MKKMLVTSAIVASVLVGCATGRITTGTLPKVQDPSASTEVVVIRVSSIVGVTNSYHIVVDDQAVFGIRSGEHTTFKIPSGKHAIGVRCFGGFTPTWKENKFDYSFQPQEKAYFVISPSLGCADIASVKPQEASTLIEKSTYKPFE